MEKLKVLNLYAGIGGNRKLWQDVDVTAVEIDPHIAAIYQDYFPDDSVIVADAHQYLLDHFNEYDFIWASPPCPTHSRMRTLWKNSTIDSNGNKTKSVIVYPDMKLYQEILLLKHFFDGKYCVENVISYYEPMIKPVISDNHYFWTNFKVTSRTNKKRGIRGQDYNPINNYFTLDGSLTKSFKTKVINNCVNPETALYILNCARNIITKSNVNQLDIFENN